jgi:hypothetical protein
MMKTLPNRIKQQTNTHPKAGVEGPIGGSERGIGSYNN